MIEEERQAVENMPNGPKKMLKMKALKAEEQTQGWGDTLNLTLTLIGRRRDSRLG